MLDDLEPEDEDEAALWEAAGIVGAAMVGWDGDLGAWVMAETGVTIADARVAIELHRHLDASARTLQALTEELFATAEVGSAEWAGAVAVWEESVAVELANAHRAYAMLANGGRVNMSAAQWGRVGGNLADEYRYLRRFAGQLLEGQVSRAQALNRVGQYVDAAQQAYWQAWRERQAVSEEIWWIRNAGAESCADCVSREGGSPYTRATLPSVPGDGATQCRGNCRCYLEVRG